MTNETANVIGDFTSNVAASAAWDFAKFAIFKLLPASIILTTLSRIGRKVFGKRPLDKTKEIAFWSLGIIGGTIVLAGICMAYSYPMERIAAQERMMFSAMMKNQAPPGHIRGKVLRALLSEDPTSKECALFFFLRVANTGAPTVVMGEWVLTVTLPNNQRFEATAIPKQQQGGFYNQFNTSSWTNDAAKIMAVPIPTPYAAFFLDAERYLPSKMAENPIPTGGGFEGSVMFELPPQVRKTAIVAGTKMEIRFEQSSNGEIIIIEHKWDASSDK